MLSPLNGNEEAILKYLDQEAERRDAWEKEIEAKVKGLCNAEKMKWGLPLE
jgi:hypothetical protein